MTGSSHVLVGKLLILFLFSDQLGRRYHIVPTSTAIVEVLLTTRLLLLLLVKLLLLVVGRGKDNVLVLRFVVGNRDAFLSLCRARWLTLNSLVIRIAHRAAADPAIIRSWPLLVLDDVASRVSGYMIVVDDIVLIDHVSSS